jgi:hypothetical protein
LDIVQQFDTANRYYCSSTINSGAVPADIAGDSTMLWTEIPVTAQPAQLIHATNTWLILTTTAVRDERSPRGCIKRKSFKLLMLLCSLTLSWHCHTHTPKTKTKNKDIHTATKN